jgi:hypothetical protein
MSERMNGDDAGTGDWLERLLADDARAHRDGYIADDGFTARVAASLPPPETLPAWRTPAVAVLWVCAIVVGAVALPGEVVDLAVTAQKVSAASRCRFAVTAARRLLAHALQPGWAGARPSGAQGRTDLTHLSAGS